MAADLALLHDLPIPVPSVRQVVEEATTTPISTANEVNEKRAVPVKIPVPISVRDAKVVCKDSTTLAQEILTGLIQENIEPSIAPSDLGTAGASENYFPKEVYIKMSFMLIGIIAGKVLKNNII